MARMEGKTETDTERNETERHGDAHRDRGTETGTERHRDSDTERQTNGWKETREPNDTVIERQRESRNTKRHRHVRTEGLRDRDRMEKETQR